MAQPQGIGDARIVATIMIHADGQAIIDMDSTQRETVAASLERLATWLRTHDETN